MKITDGALNSQQSIARTVGDARKLVGHFRHSALATAALKKRQVQMNLPEKKLKQDISTRWNSTFYMIQRLLEARWPVVAVLSDESVTKRSDRFLDLRSEKWDLLQELAKVLEPIEIATVFLSYESNVSISCIYPIVFGLLDNLQVSEDDSTHALSSKMKLNKVKMVPRLNRSSCSFYTCNMFGSSLQKP